MNYHINEISGNSYRVKLLPEDHEERNLMEQLVKEGKIGNCYRKAIAEKFGGRIQIASLTADENDPFCATVECTTLAGSV